MPDLNLLPLILLAAPIAVVGPRPLAPAVSSATARYGIRPSRAAGLAAVVISGLAEASAFGAFAFKPLIARIAPK